ncbi:purine and uridine phosphorylase [Trichoderma barbatum]
MSCQGPLKREDFDIALVCALETEFEAVSFLVDQFFDASADFNGKVVGDMNSYRTGRICKHNVVLLLLPGMGKVRAAHAVASLHSSFNRLRLVLLVGGCAAIPQINDTEILLGDVIISTGVIQYDLGRKYPSGFVRKDSFRDNLSKPHKEAENILAACQVSDMKSKIAGRAASLLLSMQNTTALHGYGVKYQYPGIREDKLYEATYRHKHHMNDCIVCNQSEDTVCDAALQASCEDLGCEKAHLVHRKRLEEKLQTCQNGDISHQSPAIFFGIFGSGDMVMRSGEDRDALAYRERVIALEMEAAGIWEELPSLIIKGAFDYGDSHKNKRWQAFASATAACTARAVIEQVAWTDRGEIRISTHANKDERVEQARNHGSKTTPTTGLWEEFSEKKVQGEL